MDYMRIHNSNTINYSNICKTDFMLLHVPVLLTFSSTLLSFPLCPRPIFSYCLWKLELVKQYIELINADNKKYIVLHVKPYRELMRTPLPACCKERRTFLFIYG